MLWLHFITHLCADHLPPAAHFLYRSKDEDATGRAIEQSGIPRKDLFITSKLWNSFHGDNVEMVRIWKLTAWRKSDGETDFAAVILIFCRVSMPLCESSERITSICT